MVKRNRFKDMHYIMNCDMPSELFTVKGIKTEYRTLAKLWHPDISSVKEALFIMSKINALYNEGLALIQSNKFYEKERLLNRNRKNDDGLVDQGDDEKVDYNVYKGDIKRSTKKRVIELAKNDGKCVKFKYLKRIMIELGFMYVSEEYVLLEITKLKRKIFTDAIACVGSFGEGYFKIEIPNVIDTFDTASHGYIVFKKERGVEPVVMLETFSGYLKALASRKICEGIFYDLTALKYQGLTSTGIDKDLIFIDVATGKLHNYGLYFYLHEFSSKLKRAPESISVSLQQLKPKSNESIIIDLVKSIVLRLNIENGLKIDDFHNWLTSLNSDSLEMSLAESQVFNRSIVSVTTHGFDIENYYASITALES